MTVLRRVFAATLAFQIVEFCGGNVFVRSVVDILHIGCKLLLILVDHIFTGVTYLMHNTYLCRRVREHGTYGLRESVKVVGTCDKYILHSASLDVCQDAHPERAAFALADPHPENFLEAVLLETNAQIHGLVDYLAVITHLENDAVHPYDDIDRIQRTVLPLESYLADLVGDDGNS